MELPSINYVRRRGVILTDRGLKKLNQAKSEIEIEQDFKRCTLAYLSQKTGLTPNTLSKVFIGCAGVDKQTLLNCFRAFNLTLETDDYIYLKSQTSQCGEICSIVPDQSPMTPVYNSSLEIRSDNSITTETNKRHQQQDSLQPLAPTLPQGKIPINSNLYINCPSIEASCYKAIQQPGATINLCAPKQMGKISLIYRILAYAGDLDYHAVYLSLQLADVKIFENLDRFLVWFCAKVSKKLGLANKIPTFWNNILGCKSNATDYFEDYLLAHLDRPVVIAIDELSQLFAYPNIAGEFMTLLRFWSNRGQANISKCPWSNLRLVTVYSTEIPMSISINQALLNGCLTIELPEFTTDRVQDLARRWG